jgi:hypothetical protein
MLAPFSTLNVYTDKCRQPPKLDLTYCLENNFIKWAGRCRNLHWTSGSGKEAD